MSFYDDYVAGGLCCESCGATIDADEPGFARMCWSCRRAAEQANERLAPKPKRRRK